MNVIYIFYKPFLDRVFKNNFYSLKIFVTLAFPYNYVTLCDTLRFMINSF